jgi:hypothetical protein
VDIIRAESRDIVDREDRTPPSEAVSILDYPDGLRHIGSGRARFASLRDLCWGELYALADLPKWPTQAELRGSTDGR